VDLAPCKVIVEEAGGRFTDFAGVPTIYSGHAFATNGALHDAALALFVADARRTLAIHPGALGDVLSRAPLRALRAAGP